MNKHQLIDALAEKVNAKLGEGSVTKRAITETLEAFVETVQDEVVKGGEVALVGFGSFKLAQRAARTARVPGTKRTVEVPARKTPVFKVGKSFKDKANVCDKGCAKKAAKKK